MPKWSRKLCVFRESFGTSLHVKHSASTHGSAEVSGRAEARGKPRGVETFQTIGGVSGCEKGDTETGGVLNSSQGPASFSDCFHSSDDSLLASE